MSSIIEKRFNEMGAEVLVEENRRLRGRFSIDVQGEIFLISGADLKNEDIKILDVQPDERHLLLMWNEKGEKTNTKHKFLCGHDERHWFVAAVPGESVKNVSDAMEALKPNVVINRERAMRVSGKEKKERHNSARRRQGEWFFVPVWHRLQVDNLQILKNEPIQRGRAKPHRCEFIFRQGGERVYVSSAYPNGITEKEYQVLIRKDPAKKRIIWRTMVRDAKVYAKGRVTHSDHATLDLGNTWHLVLMNRENEAPSMRHMRFLD
jgi:hypothetical protein